MGHTSGVNEWLFYKREALRLSLELSRYKYYNKVSQGGSISPLLSARSLTRELLLLRTLRFSQASWIKVRFGKSSWVPRVGVWLTPLKFWGEILTPSTRSSPKTNQGGTLSNATRSSRPYDLEYYELIHLAPSDAYDWEYENKEAPTLTSSNNGFKPNTLVSSPLIYASPLDLEDIKQDLTYHLKAWSGSNLERSKRLPHNDLK